LRFGLGARGARAPRRIYFSPILLRPFAPWKMDDLPPAHAREAAARAALDAATARVADAWAELHAAKGAVRAAEERAAAAALAAIAAVADVPAEGALSLSFGATPVVQGAALAPLAASRAPRVVLAGARADALYAFVLSDPDAPSVADPKFGEWQHWVVVNARGGDAAAGDVLTAFFGPAPGKDSGAHRYVLVAYEQAAAVDAAAEPRVPLDSGFPPRRSFKSRAWAARLGLKAVAAVSFFVAYDDNVPDLQKALAPPA